MHSSYICLTIKTLSVLLANMIWCARYIWAWEPGRGFCDAYGTTVCLWIWQCSLVLPTFSNTCCRQDISAACFGKRRTLALITLCMDYNQTTKYLPVRLLRTTTSQAVFCRVVCRCVQALTVWCHPVFSLPTELTSTMLLQSSVLQVRCCHPVIGYTVSEKKN